MIRKAASRTPQSRLWRGILMILFAAPWILAGPTDPQKLKTDLSGPFDLGGPRAAQVQYFRMETQVVHLGLNGKRTGTETYILKLKCVPGAVQGKTGDEFTCREFLIRQGEDKAVSIPSLAGWTYVFRTSPTGMDEKGQVLGIPHDKFENITDANGKKLPPGISYAVYNNFIDFHSFNDLLSRPIPDGRGIQDLTKIGQKIVHAAAFTEPPVNLGSQIKAGSVFRNGEMTMELKGLGLVDGAVCAVVGYDSGESTLKMIMPLSADKDIITEGGSEYAGDLYIDLATRWLRRLTLNEFVITETTLPGPGQKIIGYTVRHLLMRMTTRADDEKE